MRTATEGHLPPVMPQGDLVEVFGREVRKGSPGELMVKSSPSRQRRPPCKTSKEMSDEAADAAALTYLLTYMVALLHCAITMTQDKQCACCIQSKQELYVYTLFFEFILIFLNSFCFIPPGSKRGIPTFINYCVSRYFLIIA